VTGRFVATAIRFRRWLAVLAAAAVLPAIPIGVLRWVRPRTSAMMLERRWRRGGAGVPVTYEWVDLELISREMWRAAIAAEDAYFRHHTGFDWVSIRSALSHNRSDGSSMRGGSTISQQVAKNLFLWPGRSWLRKLGEAYLTMWIELLWTKRRILEVYLNIAQFDDDVFGVDAAARHGLGTSPRELTRQQAALLASVLPSPSRLSFRDPTHEMRFRQLRIAKAINRIDDSYLEQL